MIEKLILKGIKTIFAYRGLEYIQYGDVLIVKENGIKISVGFNKNCNINISDYIRDDNGNINISDYLRNDNGDVIAICGGYDDIVQQVKCLARKEPKNA